MHSDMLLKTLWDAPEKQQSARSECWAAARRLCSQHNHSVRRWGRTNSGSLACKTSVDEGAFSLEARITQTPMSAIGGQALHMSERSRLCAARSSALYMTAWRAHPDAPHYTHTHTQFSKCDLCASRRNEHRPSGRLSTKSHPLPRPQYPLH